MQSVSDLPGGFFFAVDSCLTDHQGNQLRRYVPWTAGEKLIQKLRVMGESPLTLKCKAEAVNPSVSDATVFSHRMMASRKTL